MKRFKKIRGHKRIWKDIDNWIECCRKLDLQYLQRNQREYAKVWVAPYRNISVLNSEFSPPKGKTRKQIVKGIFKIHQEWKETLEKLDEPYYLKVWFYPHDVSKNQVVCAIGDCLNFYEHTFFKPDTNKAFPENSNHLSWEYRQQEFHFTADDLEEPELYATYQDYLSDKKWYERAMRDSKTRITKEISEGRETCIYYSKKECDVWLGGF